MKDELQSKNIIREEMMRDFQKKSNSIVGHEFRVARTIEMATYLVEHNCSINQTLKYFAVKYPISYATFHHDLNHCLVGYPKLKEQVRLVIKEHTSAPVDDIEERMNLVVKMKEEEKMSYAEIAKKLHISKSTALGYYQRFYNISKKTTEKKEISKEKLEQVQYLYEFLLKRKQKLDQEGKTLSMIIKGTERSQIIQVLHDYRKMSMRSLGEFFGLSKSAVEKSYHQCSSSNLETNHELNFIEQIAYYGIEHNLSLQELSDFFHLSRSELVSSFHNLLPLLNSELYHLIILQYGLSKEVENLKMSSIDHRRK